MVRKLPKTFQMGFSTDCNQSYASQVGGLELKMVEKKEEHSYIIDQNDVANHTRIKKRSIIKGFAVAVTCGVLVTSAFLINQLKPWTIFSKEEKRIESEKNSSKSIEESDDENIIELYTNEENAALAAAAPVVKPLSPTAAGTCVAVQYDFINDYLYIKPGGSGSTKLYFSQDKMKTWERIMNGNGLIDLSIFLKTSDNIIYVKGNLDKNIVAITLPKEEKDLKVTYYVDKGIGKLKVENQKGLLEYRKGTNGDWRDYAGYLDLTSFEITGYTLQFRMKATANERAGKIVSVKVPKRQAPPRVKVDYSRMEISGLKAGSTLYYKTGESNPRTFAPADSKVKTLSLYDLLFNQSIAPNSQRLPAGSIEFQTAADEKKIASAIVLVEFEEQPLAPEGKIVLDKTTVTFPDATKTLTYEYTVLHASEKLELSAAKWTKVSSNKPFEIKKVGKASPAPGDIIYYRLSSTTHKETKVVTPASMYSKVIITIVPAIPTPSPKPASGAKN